MITYILEVDACFSSPCLNGGTCQSNGNSFFCTCANFYSGTTCQICKTHYSFK